MNHIVFNWHISEWAWALFGNVGVDCFLGTLQCSIFQTFKLSLALLKRSLRAGEMTQKDWNFPYFTHRNPVASVHYHLFDPQAQPEAISSAEFDSPTSSWNKCVMGYTYISICHMIFHLLEDSWLEVASRLLALGPTPPTSLKYFHFSCE